WQTKESSYCNTYIRHSRLQDKKGNERQRGAVYNDKRDTPTRRHNTYKYTCTHKGVPRYIKQVLTDLKRGINNNIIIVGGPNTLLTSMDRSSRQKVNKEIVELNEKLDAMDLIDIYGTFYSKIAEYTFFSSAHGAFKGQTICFETRQASINLRRLKSHQASFLTKML
uniref:Uncharacterized protein n=1 Tax=Equus caballus TaxID=9796 RepID=A0A9L0TLL6_HORSE